MEEKLEMIKGIFSEIKEETTPNAPPNIPVEKGGYVGGVYNGRKFMYSKHMIESLPKDKLESFIRKQIGA